MCLCSFGTSLELRIPGVSALLTAKTWDTWVLAVWLLHLNYSSSQYSPFVLRSLEFMLNLARMEIIVPMQILETSWCFIILMQHNNGNLN